MAGRLVTEAVRGEGGRLYNGEGERFMERYSPKHMELDARDVVARANYREIREGRGTPDGAVLLDISHRDPGYIKDRLPNMYEQFVEQGVDITEEAYEGVPHRPLRHGRHRGRPAAPAPRPSRALTPSASRPPACTAPTGWGETPWPRLLSSGRSSALISRMFWMTCCHPSRSTRARHRSTSRPSTSSRPEQEAANRVRRSSSTSCATSSGTMAASFARGDGLREGIVKLRDLRSMPESLRSPTPPGRRFEHVLNLRAMLTAAEAVLRSALAREESRGAHHREDFPERDGRVAEEHPLRRRAKGAMHLWTEPAGRGAGGDTQGPRRGLQPRLPLPGVKGSAEDTDVRL